MVGPRSWIGGLFNNKLFGGGKSTEITLNPVQVIVGSYMQVISFDSTFTALYPSLPLHLSHHGIYLFSI